MNAESRPVSVDVLPPLPADAYQSQVPVVTTPEAPLSRWGNFYHPASGIVILTVDLFMFPPELMTGFLDEPITGPLAFIITFPLVLLIQMKWGRNTFGASFGKAFLGAVLAALPFPITGTLLGAAVLAAAGLPHHPLEMFKRLTAPHGK